MTWPWKLKEKILFNLTKEAQKCGYKILFHPDCVEWRHIRLALRLTKKYGDFSVSLKKYKEPVYYFLEQGIIPFNDINYAGIENSCNKKNIPFQYKYEFSIVAPATSYI